MAKRLTDLKVDELKKVAEFFAVEVEGANPEKGPSKNELLAALAAEEKPITFEDYQEIYLKANPPQVDNVVDLTAIKPVEKEETKVADDEPRILIKMERANGRYDILGYTFTKDHPFHNVRQSDAEYIVRTIEGFRLAMPSELSDYYN